VVRGFARYLHALDPAVPVPPSDLLVYRRRRPTPHLFSDTDITRLLSAAAARPRPLSAATYYALFGLLAATGMRVGEAVGLDTGDVDLAAGVIVIRETKFNKSRRIPLRPSTVAVLRDYLQLRQRLCPAPKALCFFVSSRAGRITTHRAQAMFARLVEAAGLEPRTGTHPRVHDLRHSFAVATLLDWYRDGAEYRTMPMVWYIPPLSPVVDAVSRDGHDGEELGNLFGALEALRIPIGYLAGLFTAGDTGTVEAVLRRLAAMRSYMRDINLGRETQPHIPASVGMTEEQMYEMYRLLAIAKYEERYVIPSAYAAEGHQLEETATECALSFDGGPGMYESGPFGEASGGPVPVAVETFHALRQRQTGEGMAANAENPSRVNLLNWDGRGAPTGMFPR